MPIATMRVIGLKVETVAYDTVDTIGKSFVDETEVYTLFAKIESIEGLEDYKHYDFREAVHAFETSSYSAPCGSGYCMSEYGKFSSKMVSETGPLTHLPARELMFKAQFNPNDRMMFWRDIDFADIATGEAILEYSSCGGDSYYPCGYGFVNTDLFTKLPRAMDKRPVWIFKGNSGLGKSTLGLALHSAYQVFETDSVDALPDDIFASVIVLGNRSKFTVDDVKAHLWGDPKVIVVNFEE